MYRLPLLGVFTKGMDDLTAEDAFAGFVSVSGPSVSTPCEPVAPVTIALGMVFWLYFVTDKPKKYVRREASS